MRSDLARGIHNTDCSGLRSPRDNDCPGVNCFDFVILIRLRHCCDIGPSADTLTCSIVAVLLDDEGGNRGADAVVVRTPRGISSNYTPGQVGFTGMLSSFL